MELSEEEKKAIETLETEGTENNYLEVKILLNLVDKQQEEIDEKSTIIMAGAEKVKQLEKGNRSLMESRIKWKNRYYKEKAKNKEYISKDKIKEKIENIKENIETLYNSASFDSAYVRAEIDEKRLEKEFLQELLEDN